MTRSLLPSASFLPSAIAPGDDLDGLEARVALETARLERLSLQCGALRVLFLFQACPTLESISFVACNAGFGRHDWDLHFNGEPLYDRYDLNSSCRADLGPAPLAFSSWLSPDSTSPFATMICGKTIRRPPQPASLLEGVLTQCLGPQEFALWQAGSLERQAASGALAPPAAKPSL